MVVDQVKFEIISQKVTFKFLVPVVSIGNHGFLSLFRLTIFSSFLEEYGLICIFFPFV